MNVAMGLLNTLWQSAALAILLWLALRVAGPRLNAATRHRIWWIALVAIFLLPCLPQRIAAVRPAPAHRATPAAFPARIAAPFAPPASEAPITISEKHTVLWPHIAFAIWAAIFACHLLIIVRSYFHLRALKGRAIPSNRALPSLRRSAHLLLSPDLPSPVAIGFLHPAVGLPIELPDQLTPAELECVLLHESAHLSRYDDWENLAARLVRAVVTLHPVAWYILRQIDREREMACDDWVVAHTGAVHRYAESLARVVELRWEAAGSVLASGLFERRSQLRSRIETLLLRGRLFTTRVARLPILTAAVAILALVIGASLAPHWIAFAQKLEFEVVSVKRNTNNGDIQATPHRSGTLITMHNVQPYSIIYYAYHLTGAYQMIGYNRLPDGWNWFDVDARVKPETTDDQLRLMLQAMLEARFQLRVHRETREIPQYELVAGKSKLKNSAPTDEPLKVTIEGRTFGNPAGRCTASGWNDGVHLICHAAAMETVASSLANSLSSPVVDHTGLTGVFDLHVIYESEKRKASVDGPSGPSVEDAIQEFGLKLQKGKGPVEVLVIDRLEKPTEN